MKEHMKEVTQFQNKIIVKINTVYFRCMWVYVLFLLSWVFIVGSVITFTNYRINLTYPLTEALVEPWRVMRNIGLLLVWPSWIISAMILYQAIRDKKIFFGVHICIQWLLLHALLLFSFAIPYFFLSLILLFMVHKG